MPVLLNNHYFRRPGDPLGVVWVLLPRQNGAASKTPQIKSPVVPGIKSPDKPSHLICFILPIKTEIDKGNFSRLSITYLEQVILRMLIISKERQIANTECQHSQRVSNDPDSDTPFRQPWEIFTWRQLVLCTWRVA
jgi:hypothetical protein